MSKKISILNNIWIILIEMTTHQEMKEYWVKSLSFLILTKQVMIELLVYLWQVSGKPFQLLQLIYKLSCTKQIRQAHVLHKKFLHGPLKLKCSQIIQVIHFLPIIFVKMMIILKRMKIYSLQMFKLKVQILKVALRSKYHLLNKLTSQTIINEIKSNNHCLMD